MGGYAELHAHSGFSFLDGASDPEELVATAVTSGSRRSRSRTTTGSTARCGSPRRRAPSACRASSARS